MEELFGKRHRVPLTPDKQLTWWKLKKIREKIKRKQLKARKRAAQQFQEKLNARIAKK